MPVTDPVTPGSKASNRWLQPVSRGGGSAPRDTLWGRTRAARSAGDLREGQGLNDLVEQHEQSSWCT